VGVSLPMRVTKHWYTVTDILPQLEDAAAVPNVRFYDDSLYVKVQR
jgi:hypothetical protein